MVIGSPPWRTISRSISRDEFVLAHADFRVGDQHVDRFADDVGGFFDKNDFFGAFHRSDILHEIRGVFEFDVRQRLANLFKSSPGHHAFGRAHQTGESDDSDALGANFLEALDDRLAVGAARRADIFHPILGQAPPFDLVGAAHHGRNIAFTRQHSADFGLRAADLGHVARVSAELIPVSFVG